jgi:hypothetical protein
MVLESLPHEIVNTVTVTSTAVVTARPAMRRHIFFAGKDMLLTRSSP